MASKEYAGSLELFPDRPGPNREAIMIQKWDGPVHYVANFLDGSPLGAGATPEAAIENLALRLEEYAKVMRLRLKDGIQK